MDTEYIEDVEISGHIIDSLILPKILDGITAAGGSFRIKEISIGHARSDPSFALVQVRAASAERLAHILSQIRDHGAVPTVDQDCRLVPSEIDGAFPEGFYSSTNQRTEVRLDGQWYPVEHQEMDCGIVVHQDPVRVSCVPMSEIKRAQQVVVGHAGVRVFPEERDVGGQSFEFMSSAVSTEKPKGVAVRQIAEQLFDSRRKGEKTLLVGGPAIGGLLGHLSGVRIVPRDEHGLSFITQRDQTRLRVAVIVHAGRQVKQAFDRLSECVLNLYRDLSVRPQWRLSRWHGQQDPGE